jgi:hypothetical protein
VSADLVAADEQTARDRARIVLAQPGHKMTAYISSDGQTVTNFLGVGAHEPSYLGPSAFPVGHTPAPDGRGPLRANLGRYGRRGYVVLSAPHRQERAPLAEVLRRP